MEFFINEKFKSSKLLFLLLIVFVFCFNIQTSFAKEYYYQDFEVDIKINQDSTFDVTEKQTYYLDGSFGFLNRDVSLNKIDAISDIEVFDENNNKIPKSELDINSINGAKHIQWNFLRRGFNQEEKSWTVKYKVHGGISFLKDYDEIYWNAIPSKRDVAIKNVKVTVSLPNNESFRSDLIRLYSEQTLPDNYYFENNNTQAIFNGKDLRSNTNFTIAAGFPKNIVSQSAYWKDFLAMYYGYILSVIIIILSLITGFLYWHKTERSREGKRAIVPQYEPPQNLRPAMAEVIIKEKLTSRGLSATIIDLAVRGYVGIEEEKKTGKFSKLLEYSQIIIPLLIFFIPLVLIIFLLFLLSDGKNINIIVLLSLFFFVLFFISFSILKNYPNTIKNKNYTVKKVKKYNVDSNLKDYEKEYLNALFGLKECFSTKELKKDQIKARALYQKIQKVKDKIYKETELDTKAFEIGLTAEKTKNFIFGVLGLILLFIFIELFRELGQFFVLLITIIASAAALYAFIKYEARLSNEGIKLKEDWLGFKMYLETAERYRMQNLKPEYFEKYLPYAMIFGVEKKWAKAFETMNIPQPTWYGGAAMAGSGSGVSASSFSPSAFSASFASSFSSAFASSGASGASGGGGGAGGGGGGGGGGAG